MDLLGISQIDDAQMNGCWRHFPVLHFPSSSIILASKVSHAFSANHLTQFGGLVFVSSGDIPRIMLQLKT